MRKGVNLHWCKNKNNIHNNFTTIIAKQYLQM